jgi:hypothetical protein
MDYSTIFTVGFLVLSLVVVLFAILYGFKRTGFQSTIRLVVLVCAILLAVVVTVSLTPEISEQVNDYANSTDDETVKEFLTYISGDGGTAESFRQIISALCAPIIFVITFVILNFVFLIIYSIVGAFTFSQGHKKRKASRKGEKYRAGIISRVSSIVLNIVICFTIASMLLLPVTYYMPLASAVMESTQEITSTESADTEEGEESADTSSYLDVVKGFSESQIIKVYGFEGTFITNEIAVLDVNGDKVKLENFVVDLFDVVGDITALSSQEVSSTQFYAVADSASKDEFTDKLLGGLMSDAATNWKDGESFLGVEPIVFQSEELSKSVYEVLSKQETISGTMRALGHIYALTNVLSSSGGTSSATLLAELCNNLTGDSVEIVKSLLSDSVMEQLGVTDTSSTQKITGAVNGILDGLYDVKQNGTADDVQRESQAIAKVFDTVQNIDGVTESSADDMISALKDSTVMQDVLSDMVEDNPNPMNIQTSEETSQTIKNSLEKYEIEEGSELYETVIDFFGISD